jgi:chromosomal replication initiation ATPase DnaA
MSGRGLDQRFTFETFIVGTANRLASAAARRVAETPGKAYNPLFLYGASGLGKTHLLQAIGNHAGQMQPNLRMVMDTAERAVQQLAAGEEAFAGAQLVLLDDVQYLAGDRRAQDTLLVYWDELAGRGAQLVLVGDRPPTEIDRLDHRLLSRFSAGLIADIGPPDYDMRTEIVRRRADERGHTLEAGVAESIARVAFANVRELQGGLNRVIASQELDGRQVQEGDVAALLGFAMERTDSEEFDSFLSEVVGAVAEIATRVTPEQRLVDAILRYEGEGYRTYRLEVALRHPPAEQEVIDLCDRFAADVERLVAITTEVKRLDADAPELARADLLRNPDRVLEAETLLAQVHERLKPLPEPEPGPGLDAVRLPEDNPALGAARAVAKRPGARPVPLYIRGAGNGVRTALLEGLARDIRREMPMLPIAVVNGPSFADEIDSAIRTRRADTWRARYRRARLIVVDEFDRVETDDAVRDEIFRLFDGVRRSGGQIVLAGERDPGLMSGHADRLGALVGESDVAEVEASAPGSEDGAMPPDPSVQLQDTWFTNREKTLPQWPYIEDWLITELE